MSLDAAGRKVVVLGLARTGRAVAEVLARRGAHVRASDAGPVDPDDLRRLRDAGVEVEDGGHRLAASWLADADLVVPSPGIPPTAPLLAAAAEHGLPVHSEIEVASRMTSAPVIAVTGTNGKTTVCRLLGAVFDQASVDAVVCGNIGNPFIAAVDEHPGAPVFVVEVSSFQLEFCHSFHPRVAVVTNVAPDHLDWHGSMTAYRAAKGRIAVRQTSDDVFVHPADQPDLAELAPVPGPRRIAFAPGDPGGEGVWAEGSQVVWRTADGDVRPVEGAGPLATLGRPFLLDGLAAAAAVLTFGLPVDAVGRALGAFRPDAHRVEPVGELGGVRFYDDSKATNPHATAAAVRGFDSVVLIAGGRNKGLDLGALREEAGRLRAVVAIGEAADEVVEAFSGLDVPVRTATEMDDAVAAAYSSARPGDVILLSPACTSWDRFRDYAHRGDVFKEACRMLIDRVDA